MRRIPGIALADAVSSARFDALPAGRGGQASDDAVIRLIAIETGAQFIFEFGRRSGSIAAKIAAEGQDTHAIVTDQTAEGALPNLRSETGQAIQLTPQAVERAEALRHIDTLHGTGAHLAFAPWIESCDLVIVDGARDCDHARCDSLTALHLAKAGGTIVWCFYQTASGVTQALDDLYASDPRLAGLHHIAGTSLCLWRKPVLGYSEGE